MNFFKNKSIFLTGHTGFKGAWLCEILKILESKVTGYALEPKPGSLFEVIKGEQRMQSVIGDIRDRDHLLNAFTESRPEIVFHLAAQPLVLDSYKLPAYTFETNVMGTVNLLECVRQSDTVRSVVIVTTDKVYQNLENNQGYKENDKLGGHDPYSSSKACTELVAESYSASFLKENNIPLSTARAGNVIGGGDTSENRIIPDCVRAALKGKTIVVRNPHAVRPYQHVLEPLLAYLLIAQCQWDKTELAGNYNIGPKESDCITTGALVDIFCEKWRNEQKWEIQSMPDSPHEAGLLYLDCGKIRQKLNWQPLWNVEDAVEKTVAWEKNKAECNNMQIFTRKQIESYMLKKGFTNEVC